MRKRNKPKGPTRHWVRFDLVAFYDFIDHYMSIHNEPPSHQMLSTFYTGTLLNLVHHHRLSPKQKWAVRFYTYLTLADGTPHEDEHLIAMDEPMLLTECMQGQSETYQSGDAYIDRWPGMVKYWENRLAEEFPSAFVNKCICTISCTVA